MRMTRLPLLALLLTLPLSTVALSPKQAAPQIVAAQPPKTAPLLVAFSQPRQPRVVLSAAKAEPAAAGITRKQALLFALTYVAYVAIYCARKPVSVIKSTLETELGLSRAQLGVLDTSMLSSYAVGQFLTGSIVALLGRTSALGVAYLVCGLCCALCGTIDNVGLMSVFWGGCGFFAAAVNPLLVLFVSDLFPASMRASAVGLWQTSQQLGGVVANALSSAVLQQQGWRAVFLSSGAIVGSFGVLLVLGLTFSGASSGPALAPKPTRQQPKRGAVAAPSVLSLQGVKSLAGAYTLVKMARCLTTRPIAHRPHADRVRIECAPRMVFWLPYFFSKHIGMPASTSAMVATLFDITGVLGSITSGFLADSVFKGRMLGTVQPFIVGTALALAGWAALCKIEAGGPPIGGGALHVLAMALVGFLIAGPDGVLGGAAARNLCDYAGVADGSVAASASGLVNGCGSIGAILQGWLAASLIDAAGWAGLFASLAAAMLATTVILQPAIALEAEAVGGRAQRR